jgi:hypothetical protein
VRAGHNLKAIADYVGTSTAMIEQNYCARLQLKPDNREIFESLAKKVNEIMVAGPGFEPGAASASKDLQLLSAQQIRGLKARKIG